MAKGAITTAISEQINVTITYFIYLSILYRLLLATLRSLRHTGLKHTALWSRRGLLLSLLGSHAAERTSDVHDSSGALCAHWDSVDLELGSDGLSPLHRGVGVT